MKKQVLFTLIALFAAFSSFALTPITGLNTVCTGDNITLADTTAGGTWSTSSTAIAVINPLTGVLTGVTAGTTTVSYTLGTSVTYVVTVNTTPAAISGPSSLCTGATATYTTPTTGGVWSTAYYYLSVTSSGFATAVSPGWEIVKYSIGGCSATTFVNVSSGPAVKIKGSRFLCLSATTTLTDSVGSTGGTWSSSNTSVATVSGGVVTGVATGVSVISYSLTGTCGTTLDTFSVSVGATTTTGTISGASGTYVSGSFSLYPSVSGGAWSASNTSVASISSSGIVAGIASGTATISYAVTGCGGTAYATHPVTITPFDGISGDVLFTGSPFTGYIKVYLVTYNPTTLDLQASDSLTIHSSIAHYQFLSLPTDSFRVKASIDTVVATGYMNTYHNSSFHWSTANVIYHTAGTGDINKNINMMAGVSTPGPGFIGGSVLTGANKGTAGGIAAGLHIFLLDATGKPIAQTKTNAAGKYSFTGLAAGSYSVFPEALNYKTTPYSVTLSPSAASATAVSFTQHTISYTITPNPQQISEFNTIAFIKAFPNPADGMLTLEWNRLTAEKATITVSDITGREVYTTKINMLHGSSSTHHIDVSGISNGTYIINVTTGTDKFIEKIQVQH